MPASLIVPMLGLTNPLAIAAANFGIRALTTIALSSLLAKQVDQPTSDVGQQGGRVQLSPATDNKLPVLYGESWVSGAVTDAKISTDQQTMWYVVSIGERTDSGTVSIEDVYWDDKLLLFSASNPSEIEGWYNESDYTRVTGVSGKISMWFFDNGSTSECGHRCRTLSGTADNGRLKSNVTAFEILGANNTEISEANRWTNKDRMSNTIFAIVRVKYDQDHGVTGLGQLRFKVKNTLGTTTGDADGTGPGSVIKDYLLNSRYGAGVPLSNIDTDSLSALDDFSYEQLTLTTPDDQTFTTSYRYRIDGPVNTSNDCLTNLTQLTQCCDSWLQWNELSGQWGVVINDKVASTSTMTVITADNIIGGISVNPNDIKSMGNSCRVTFPNKAYLDQTDFRYIPYPDEFWLDNEPVNEINLTLPFVNNHIQATWLGYKRLWESRNDIVINFTMDYSGIKINAGDVIAVKHEWYGWIEGTYGATRVFPGKPFRVTQVKEYKDADGFLFAQIVAVQYQDAIYEKTDYDTISQITFSGISDTEEINNGFVNGVAQPPTAPWIPADFIDEENGTFVVRAEVPKNGNTIAMEFWYSIKGPDWENNNYTLYSTQFYAEPNRGAVYPKFFDDGVTPYYEEVIAVNLPPGEYWFKSRAIGANATSDFSETSDYNG